MCNCADPNSSNATPCTCTAAAATPWCPPPATYQAAELCEGPPTCEPLRESLLQLLERSQALADEPVPPPATPPRPTKPAPPPPCYPPPGFPPERLSFQRLADGDCERPRLAVEVTAGAVRADGFVEMSVRAYVEGSTATRQWSVSFNGGVSYTFVTEAAELRLTTATGRLKDTYFALLRATYRGSEATARIVINPVTGEWALDRGVSLPEAGSCDHDRWAVVLPNGVGFTSAQLTTSGDMKADVLGPALWRVTGSSGTVTGSLTATACGKPYTIPLNTLRATGTGGATATPCPAPPTGRVVAYRRRNGSYYLMATLSTLTLTEPPVWVPQSLGSGFVLGDRRLDYNGFTLEGAAVSVTDACGTVSLTPATTVTAPPEGVVTPPPPTPPPPPLVEGSSPPPLPAEPLVLAEPLMDCSTGQLTLAASGGGEGLREYRIAGLRDWGPGNVFQVPLYQRQSTSFTAEVRQGGQQASRSFVTACPAPPPATPPATPLAATLVSYDCATGAIVFGHSGGDPQTAPQWQAVGVTDWTGEAHHTIAYGIRNNADAEPLTIRVRQGSAEGASYTFDFRAYCATGSSPTATYAVTGLHSEGDAEGSTVNADNSPITDAGEIND